MKSAIMEYELLDNVLGEKDLKDIQKRMTDINVLGEYDPIVYKDQFSWFYSPTIVGGEGKKDISEFMFCHLFYQRGVPISPFYTLLMPFLNIIRPLGMERIKANLQTRTEKIKENRFHVDIPQSPTGYITSIFYVNTNDGYTKFEDGTKIESVANRLVSFPGDKKHLGTTCTDQSIRVVINFNYFAAVRHIKKYDIKKYEI